MEQQNLSPTVAENLVNENDVIRANFIESSNKVRWDSATLFDLVVDTSKVPPQSAINWLIETNRNLEQRSEEGLRITNEIKVRSVLEKVVSDTLDCQATH